jgi:hypothetical protein
MTALKKMALVVVRSRLLANAMPCSAVLCYATLRRHHLSLVRVRGRDNDIYIYYYQAHLCAYLLALACTDSCRMCLLLGHADLLGPPQLSQSLYLLSSSESTYKHRTNRTPTMLFTSRWRLPTTASPSLLLSSWCLAVGTLPTATQRTPSLPLGGRPRRSRRRRSRRRLCLRQGRPVWSAAASLGSNDSPSSWLPATYGQGSRRIQSVCSAPR